MAEYRIEFKPSAIKDLRALPSVVQARILKSIEALKQNPLPKGAVKLTGSQNLYRIRVGEYRVIYAVEHSMKLILIHYIRHRREVYRSL